MKRCICIAASVVLALQSQAIAEEASKHPLAKPEKTGALKYRIMIRDAKGAESIVDETKHVFQPGEKFRIIVEADHEAFLYVLHESTDGDRQTLVPDQEDPTGYVPTIKPGKTYVIPRDGYFEVTPPAGIERLLVFATAHKQPREIFADTETLTEPQKVALKRQQDRVFESALRYRLRHTNHPGESDVDSNDVVATGPRIRLRGLAWQPRHAARVGGKTVFIGSHDKGVKPDLLLEIPLASKK